MFATRPQSYQQRVMHRALSRLPSVAASSSARLPSARYIPSLAARNAGPLPSNKGRPAPATSRPLTSVPTARRRYQQRRPHTRAATHGITYVDERAPTGSATMADHLAGPNIITLVPRLLISPLVSLAFFFYTSSRIFPSESHARSGEISGAVSGGVAGTNQLAVEVKREAVASAPRPCDLDSSKSKVISEEIMYGRGLHTSTFQLNLSRFCH